MVILNIRTGEIMAMASFPLFDPNLFVPSPTAQVYQRLLKDKTLPLFPRAFQGEYPPASTFKVIVALAGLETGTITPRTAFNCVTAFQVGDRVFHNWNKDGEGDMNVVTAIKRSCNTWFYQAGLATEGGPITDMAVRMGFGERTGVPLVRAAGLCPDGFVDAAAFRTPESRRRHRESLHRPGPHAGDAAPGGAVHGGARGRHHPAPSCGW